MTITTLPTVTYTTTDSPELEATHAAFESALSAVRDALGRDHPMRIAGRPVTSGAWVEDRSPTDPAVLIGRVPGGTTTDAGAAVDAARAAARDWMRWPWRDRLAIIRDAADRLERQVPDLAAWLAVEVGKSRLEALGEASEIPALLRYYCDQVEEADGYDRGERAIGHERARSLLRPYGVWAIVSPFNFPLATGAGMAGAALAAGNAVVMKPATEAPLLTLRFAAAVEDALRAAGAPLGTISVVTGPAGSVGSALVEHPGIDGVAFTGSVAAGGDIGRALAVGPVRRPLVAEMGGKNPVIVAASADLDAAVDGVVRSAFGFSGQKCSATSRVYVDASVADAFRERLVAATEALTIGDPVERGVDVGPVINEAAIDRFSGAVRLAQRDGRVLTGGHRSSRIPGYLAEPTVVTDLPIDHALLRDELFLPFLGVAVVADLDEAIGEANATTFGLTAGLFSQDEHDIERFFEEVESGVLYVNRRAGATSGAWPGVQAFTGWKASGSSGKGALGPWYVQQFLREQARTVVIG